MCYNPYALYQLTRKPMTSEDGYKDAATVAQEAISEEAASETPPQDVESEETESEIVDVDESTDDNETESDDTGDQLTDAQVRDLGKFKKLDPEEREAKVKKMLASGRSDQVENAKFLQDTFSIELEEETTVDMDGAIKAALEQYGLTPDTLTELQEKKEVEDQKAAVKDWAKLVGMKPSEVLRNKEFVKAYHKSDKESIEDRVADAVKAFSKDRTFPDPDKARATINLSSTGKSAVAEPKKSTGYINMKTMLDGKTLDEIDLSQF